MGDLKDDYLGKVTEDMDVFKQIAQKIPGFAGYIDRTKRRDADKLLRETLADRFAELEGRVSALQRELIGAGQIQYVDDLEAAAIKLRTFADRVRRAPRGYAGLFDAVKVNSEELEALYQYDAAMLNLVDEVERAIDHVAVSIGDEGLEAAIRNLVSKTQECIDVYNRREEAIMGVSG